MINKKGTKVFGRNEEDMIDKNILEDFSELSEEGREKFIQFINKSINNDNNFDINNLGETAILHSSGSIKYIDWNVTPLIDEINCIFISYFGY